MAKRVVQQQVGSKKIRNKPLSPELVNLFTAVGEELDVYFVVTSGGQTSSRDKRLKGKTGGWTGSHRHDDGDAGDTMVYRLVDGEKRYLDFTVPEDQAIWSDVVRLSVAGGATGIGAGTSYMGSKTVHIGYGRKATWGTIKKGGPPPPAWLVSAYDAGEKTPPLNIPNVASDVDVVDETGAVIPFPRPLEQVQQRKIDVVARQRFMDAAAANGVRLDGTTTREELTMTPGQNYYAENGLLIGGNNLSPLLVPGSTADDVGAGPDSWFDVAPGGLGSTGTVSSGALFAAGSAVPVVNGVATLSPKVAPAVAGGGAVVSAEQASGVAKLTAAIIPKGGPPQNTKTSRRRTDQANSVDRLDSLVASVHDGMTGADGRIALVPGVSAPASPALTVAERNALAAVPDAVTPTLTSAERNALAAVPATPKFEPGMMGRQTRTLRKPIEAIPDGVAGRWDIVLYDDKDLRKFGEEGAAKMGLSLPPDFFTAPLGKPRSVGEMWAGTKWEGLATSLDRFEDAVKPKAPSPAPRPADRAPALPVKATPEAETRTEQRIKPTKTSTSTVRPATGTIAATGTAAASTSATKPPPPIYVNAPPVKTTTMVPVKVTNPAWVDWNKTRPTGGLSASGTASAGGTVAAGAATLEKAPPQYITVQKAVTTTKPGGKIKVSGKANGPIGKGSGSATEGLRATVKIASGKTVAVGSKGSSQSGRYTYSVREDGSIVNDQTGRVTAQAPKAKAPQSRSERFTNLDQFGMIS